ncbi:MAG: DUF4214 domain-containing protein [Actinomycetota bacterium]
MKYDRKYLASYILLFIGFVIILREFIGGRSLWVDEAMLALNIDKPFSQLLLPLDYNQTAPILFLYLSKVFTLVFGISDYSLRVTPLLFGLGSLYLFFLISKKILNKYAAAFSMLLFILSYKLIYYCNEFKHYSAEVFFSLFFFYLFLEVREKGLDIKKAALIGIAGVVACGLTFNSAFVLSMFLVFCLYFFIREKNRKGIASLALPAVMWGAALGTEYFFVYLGNPNFQFEPLLDYWAGGYMPFPPKSLEELLWLPRTIKEFFIFISNTDTILTGRFPVIIDIYAYLFIVFFVIGTVYAFRDKKAFLPAYGSGLIFLAIIASALNIIPFGDRLALYIVPLVLLVCALGIYYVFIWARKVHKSLAIAFLILLFFLPAIPKVYHLAEPTYKVEIKPVVNYYLENRKPGDKVFIEIDINSYYPPQFFFYTGENFDFTNVDGSGEKDLPEIREAVLGYERVWVIGDIGKLKNYGEIVDSYKVETLASRWPFEFLREDIIHLNKPNAQIFLYDFRQYELEEFINKFYVYGKDRNANGEELFNWTKKILKSPLAIRELSGNLLEAGLKNKEFIAVLYKVLLDREPDDAGLEHWVSTLEQGSRREEIIEKIINSGEFKARLERDFGIQW